MSNNKKNIPPINKPSNFFEGINKIIIQNIYSIFYFILGMLFLIALLNIFVFDKIEIGFWQLCFIYIFSGRLQDRKVHRRFVRKINKFVKNAFDTSPSPPPNIKDNDGNVNAKFI